MHVKSLVFAALAARSFAQVQNLTATLAGNTDLTNLTTYFARFPKLLREVVGASNITILAPSNEAFAALAGTPEGLALASRSSTDVAALLGYHVLNGTYPASAITNTAAFVPSLLHGTKYTNVSTGQVVEVVKQGDSVEIYSGLLSNSTVTTPDVNFTGGVIHVINRVLTEPLKISVTAQQAGLSAAVGALKATKLVDAVDSAKDITVFVPNNDAFQNIGSATANLTTEQLGSILDYHVVNGTVGYSSALTNGTTLTARNGGSLTITIANGNIFVNSAKVVLPDVLVANGVVHVIDNVLNPNATSATPDPSASTQAVAYSGASRATDDPLTSGVPAPTASVGTGPTPVAGGAGGAGGASTTAGGSGGAAGGPASSSSSGLAIPMKTGAIEVAALFAGAGILANM